MEFFLWKKQGSMQIVIDLLESADTRYVIEIMLCFPQKYQQNCSIMITY